MTLEPCTSSGLKTSAGVIYAKPATLAGLEVNPAAADTTVTIYDNASAASGTVLAKVLVKASTTGVYVKFPEGGIGASLGLYADFSGASAEYVVHFRPYR